MSQTGTRVFRARLVREAQVGAGKGCRGQMLEWIQQHRVSLLWAGGASAFFIVVMMIVTPIVVVHLPADYFQRQGQGRGKSNAGRGAGGRIARNILGWLLIAGGIVML